MTPQIYSILASAMTVISFVMFIAIVVGRTASTARRRTRTRRTRRSRCPTTCRQESTDMSDFTSDFWSVYVAGLTIASIVACGILLYVMGRMRVAKGKSPDTTGHVWDEDLAEYNNPLPRWWMWLFYITIAFGVLYLALYPGLGKVPGLLGWTSAEAYAKERTSFDKEVAPLYARFSGMDVAAIAKDPAARAIGERLFLNNCAQCHGSDAGGGKGYPSLRDTDWLYGGEPAAINASITNGRNGVMPAFGVSLGQPGVDNVVNYVRSLSGLPVTR
jgi:cytochrome c oxidase cbb3-type subunit 3